MPRIQGGTRGTRSFRKRAAFSMVACVLGYLLLEVAAGAALLWSFGDVTFAAGHRRSVAGELEFHGRRRVDLLHPFQGYVLDPVSDPEDPGGSEISAWGYRDERPPLRKRSDGKVVVALMGGSVAEHLSLRAADELADELKQDSRFADKEVEFVRLALGGYKQPQQLMALTYLLSLGGEFDMVINLDGFNEVALSVTENAANSVFPSFPRNWHFRVWAAENLLAARIRGKSLLLEERRQNLARGFEWFPWRYSLTATGLWTIWDQGLQTQILSTHETYRELAAEMPSPAATGPYQPFDSEEELYRHCTDVWRQSSLQLHRLCQANGIAYYHFLQPNQYLPDSKPITQQERIRAVHDDQMYRKPVEIGYPMLIRAARELSRAGVNFHDLTQIFADHPDPLYIDNCCHLNLEGNRLLARRIGELIRSEAPQE